MNIFKLIAVAMGLILVVLAVLYWLNYGRLQQSGQRHGNDNLTEKGRAGRCLIR